MYSCLQVNLIWGLHDMHGNVKEWVSDDYYQYTSESKIDPIAPDYYGKMIRGGGYKGWLTGSRSSYRYAHLESMSDQGAGLCPRISPNGKFLFFVSRRVNKDFVVYWAIADFIEKLKPKKNDMLMT